MNTETSKLARKIAAAWAAETGVLSTDGTYFESLCRHIENGLCKEPVAWRRLDTPKSCITENPDIVRGWELDGLPFESLVSQN